MSKLFFCQPDGFPVDAIPHTGWRVFVWEQVTQMLSAAGTEKLNSFPSVSAQRMELHAITLVQPERRKAAAGLKLFCCIKQSGTTGSANIVACGVSLFYRMIDCVFQLRECLLESIAESLMLLSRSKSRGGGWSSWRWRQPGRVFRNAPKQDDCSLFSFSFLHRFLFCFPYSVSFAKNKNKIVPKISVAVLRGQLACIVAFVFTFV